MRNLKREPDNNGQDTMQITKRKQISPPDDKRVEGRKRAKRGDVTYAEVCREDTAHNVNTREERNNDSSEEWSYIEKQKRKKKREKDDKRRLCMYR
jgi:hypothetical protein